MLDRRHVIGLAAAAPFVSAMATAQAAPSAAERMNELGPENQALVSRAGLWNVTETVWDAPGAAPVITSGLVAERKIIGSFLQETMHSVWDSATGGIKRIDYLTFNRVDGRWDYVSMDTRAPVGIMPAWSFDGTTDSGIVLLFAPLTIAGTGSDVAGRELRMDEVITHDGPDRDTKDQHFIVADGTGTKWLAHRYAYVRRPLG